MAPLTRPDRRRRARRAVRAAALAVAVAAVIAAALLLRPPPPLPAEAGPGAVRIVTYNIRAGLGGLGDVAEDLRRLSPDVVALQEVERGVARSGGVDQAAALAAELGMEHTFAGAVRSAIGGEHGVAILSRYPLRDVETVALPHGTARWPRVALKARVDAPGGAFRMVSIHLTQPHGWPLSHLRTRLAQVDTLLRSVEGDELPVVVAGDFNSFPFSPEAVTMGRRLRNAWKPWRDGPALSFGLRVLGRRIGSVQIDHVFHDPEWSSRGTWAAPQGGSDHRPVVADLVPGWRPAG